MVCSGAELEIGWLPLLQTQAGNPNIQSGQPGMFEAARQLVLLEVPTRLDRSLGDMHAAGNPHVHLDPRNIAKVAAALADRMAQLDHAEAAYYRDRAKSFLERWQQATARWEKGGRTAQRHAARRVSQGPLVLINWLGMREVGSLEPKPGLPPTTPHLSELLTQLQKNPAKVVVRSAYNNPQAAEFLAERAKIPAIMLPYTVGGTEQAKDLFGLYDDTLARLLKVAK